VEDASSTLNVCDAHLDEARALGPSIIRGGREHEMSGGRASRDEHPVFGIGMEDEGSVGRTLSGHDVFPESLKSPWPRQFAKDVKGF
jgi:hypothetical protein